MYTSCGCSQVMSASDLCKSHDMTAIQVEQHVAAAMKIADRVIIMNSGQIVFDGLPQQTRESNF